MASKTDGSHGHNCKHGSASDKGLARFDNSAFNPNRRDMQVTPTGKILEFREGDGFNRQKTAACGACLRI